MELDLRQEINCQMALWLPGKIPFDEVYQLAAEMGGMGYISSAECDIMRNSCLVNLHMIHNAALAGVKSYFFSSSACVYPNQDLDAEESEEHDAYPAFPHNEYGWEKLFSERVLQAYGRKYPMRVRIARFQNTYGPESHWIGGREKAPAAMCRKVAECPNGGKIEVWGGGGAVRAYTYISDTIDGIRALMNAESCMHGFGWVDLGKTSVDIGRREYVTVDELAKTVIEISGKNVGIVHVPGPEGVANRRFRAAIAAAIGWESKVSLHDGLKLTYDWVSLQVAAQQVFHGMKAIHT
jgi:nucleoside-diphosphate-sugar epimerase